MLFSCLKNCVIFYKYKDKCTPILRATTCLGVLIDESLNWTHQITKIKSKLPTSVGIVYRYSSAFKRHYYVLLRVFSSIFNVVYGNMWKHVCSI